MQLEWLARREITFRQVSSMVTMARPWASWPVTTRLIARVTFSSWCLSEPLQMWPPLM